MERIGKTHSQQAGCWEAGEQLIAGWGSDYSRTEFGYSRH